MTALEWIPSIANSAPVAILRSANATVAIRLWVSASGGICRCPHRTDIMGSQSPDRRQTCLDPMSHRGAVSEHAVAGERPGFDGDSQTWKRWAPSVVYPNASPNPGSPRRPGPAATQFDNAMNPSATGLHEPELIRQSGPAQPGSRSSSPPAHPLVRQPPAARKEIGDVLACRVREVFYAPKAEDGLYGTPGRLR